MIAWIVAALVTAAPAPDTRVAVVVGNNVGLPEDVVLRYAEADAKRMHTLLVESGGVEPSRAALVLGGTARDVERAIAEAAGRVDELARLGPVSMIVYVSSHADERDLHLEGTRLPIAQVRAAIAKTAASLRLVIVDACRTEVRDKGGRPAPEVAVTFDRGTRVEGDVLITSAGSGEAAQEWGQLSGSLFTHHLTTGLRGVADADQNGAVTLSEAYAYAYRRTAAAAIEGRGAQHPSFDFRVEGWGEWAFTRPERWGARLVLAEDVGGLVWVTDRKRELVAEVVKVRGEQVAVGLAPGWYRVVVPEGSGALAADVNLNFQGARTVSARELVRTRLREVALKGSEPIVLRPWRVAAGYRMTAGMLSGMSAVPFGDVTLTRDLAPWLARIELGAGAGSLDVDGARLDTQTLRVGAAFGAAWREAWWALEAGAGIEVHGVRQQIERKNGALVERLFGELDPPRTGALAGPFAFVGFGVQLGDRFGVVSEVQGAAIWVPLAGGGALRPTLSGRVGVEWWF